MVQIEWGDLEPAPRVREQVEARLASLRTTPLLLKWSKRGSACEVRLQLRAADHASEVRFHGDQIIDVVDRLLDLLTIIELESTKRAR